MKQQLIRKPDTHMLKEFAPLDIWMSAEKAAARSTVKLFHTGSVIWQPKMGRIITTGCSHPRSDGTHCHAEEHALQRVAIKDHNQNLECIIVTLTQAGNWASNSRPCARCVQNLASRGIGWVIYPYLNKQTDLWEIHKERVGDLYNVAFADGLLDKVTNNSYARTMRVKLAQ